MTADAGSPAADPPASPDAEEAAKHRLLVLYLATGASALLFFASFHPIDEGLLAWVCLVPLFFFALRETTRAALVMGYAATFLGHLTGLAWIALVTAPGWLMTTFLEGFYTAAIIWVVRRVRERLGWSVTLVLPPLWVAGEYSRGAHLAFIKFPWLLLGQTQHARSNLIQIADLASCYGIGFLVVLVNAFLIDALLLWDERRAAGRSLEPADVRRLARLGAWPLGLLLLANVYGAIRSAQVESSLRPDAPKVLAVQTDIPQDVKEAGATAREMADMNFNLTRSALAGLKEKDLPDAIIWTETTWPWQVNVDYPDFRRFDHYLVAPYNKAWPSNAPGREAAGDLMRRKTQELFQLVEQEKCDLLVGAVDRGEPETIFTKDAILHNSVYQIAPGPNGTAIVKERYDKCNLVPASEGIPGQGTAFDFFYKLVKKFVPEGFVTFEAGKGPHIMTLAREPHWKLSTDICFEVSFPELVAEGTRQGADVLVCPSNDGWFHTKADLASAEINLAYDHAQLRAIESRRGMVRVVNRGVTCILDPLGRLVDQVEGTTRTRTGERVRSNLHIEGTLLARVPTTSLTTVYVAVGDLFAWLTWIATGVIVFATFRPALFRRKSSSPGAALAP